MSDTKDAKPVVKAAAVKEVASQLPTTIVLIYTGDGASIPDVPARDLTDADLTAIADLSGDDKVTVSAALISSNLYKGA